MLDLVLALLAGLYFLYPVAYAFVRKAKKPILLGVSAHGVNFSVLLLCSVVYLPVHVWLLFLAPQLDDFGYLTNLGAILNFLRLVGEYGAVVFLLIGVFVTPYFLRRCEDRRLG